MSYQDELDDLNADILLELYRRHIKSKGKAPTFASPASLLSLLKKTGVRKDAEDLPLSSYLRRVRIDADVSLEDIAAALGLPSNLLGQLEANYSVPWTVPPSLVADVACLFRLHVKAVEALTQNSYQIAYFSGHMSDRELSTQLMSSWLAEVRLELERREAKDLVD